MTDDELNVLIGTNFPDLPGGLLKKDWAHRIEDAWDVWTWLRNSGDWCTLNIHSDGSYCYVVTLLPRHYSDRKHTINITCAELPRAICLAALVARGVPLTKKAMTPREGL